MGKEALAVKRGVLFRDGGAFQGFVPNSVKDYMQIIMGDHSYHPRGDALENDESLKQMIPYVWIVNPETQQVFVYKRAGNEKYSEVRLRNKWSGGLGGHIERIDAHNPIGAAMMRELKEEVRMDTYPEPKIVGYLNDDGDSVGRVHFGIVAIVETNGPVTKGDEEMAHGKLHTIAELESLMRDTQNHTVEEWTRMSWPFVRNYLLSR